MRISVNVSINRGVIDLPRSLYGFQLASTDLDEARHARGIDTETFADEIVVGSQSAQAQSDPVSPRQDIKVATLHCSRVP